MSAEPVITRKRAHITLALLVLISLENCVVRYKVSCSEFAESTAFRSEES